MQGHSEGYPEPTKYEYEHDLEIRYNARIEQVQKLYDIINKLLDMPFSTKEEQREYMVYRHKLKLQRLLNRQTQLALRGGEIELPKI